MFVIGIANDSQDENGNAILKPEEISSYGGERRVSRIKTLDGGTVVNDGGFAQGDRTITLAIPYTDLLRDLLWNLFKTASYIVITTEEGAFRCTFQGMSVSNGQINITIWVREIIS